MGDMGRYDEVTTSLGRIRLFDLNDSWDSYIYVHERIIGSEACIAAHYFKDWYHVREALPRFLPGSWVPARSTVP
jgi:hypothetical protein